MKSKTKKIAIFATSLVFVASLATVLSTVVVSKSKSISIENNDNDSSNNITNNLCQKIKDSKYFESLFEYEGNELVIDESNVRNNLNKVIIDAVSMTSDFKYKKLELKDIDLKTKYELETNKKLNVNCIFSYGKNNGNNESNFSILIN